MQDRVIKKNEQGIDYFLLERGENLPFIFMLHGYGANGEDLIPLSIHLDEQKKYNWVFLEAPNDLAGPFYGAKAWFPIDEKALQKAMMTGEPRNFKEQYVPTMNDLTQEVEKVIRIITGKNPFLLGGFSQGAMLSLHLHHKFDSDELLGLLLMSGALVDIKNLKLNKKKSIEVLITHGRQDQVILYNEGEDLCEYLKEHDYENVDFYPFYGGHEISMDALSKIKKIINKIWR